MLAPAAPAASAAPAGGGKPGASPSRGKAPGAAAAAAPAPGQPLTRELKIQVLDELDVNEVRTCTDCVLCQGRTQTVFGEGDPDAELMFIGEGPGQTEDELGRPFVGRAGELLNKMIQAVGLTREQVYIANVVKCRPPNNRTPTPMEVQTCSGFLRRQIQTIAPKVIVTLGGPATKHMLNTSVGITALRGTWHQYEGLLPDGPAIAVMPTFHPAFILRSYTEDNRRKVWNDLQEAVKRIGKMPRPSSGGDNANP